MFETPDLVLAGISIEEAPSVEMSPLELQVLMDKRHGQLGQYDNRQLSPRPQYQVTQWHRLSTDGV